MARKCVFAHLRSAWQQKPGVIHRYAKDTILKKLFPPVLLHIRISVCELKKSQPKAFLPNPFGRGCPSPIGCIQRYHAIEGANDTTMVVMFVGYLVVFGLTVLSLLFLQ